ncbi:MAG: hypothetical protein IK954_05445 [Clostridia bacterium]|nr:hypothetical protein [Clostridia bacterium]
MKKALCLCVAMVLTVCLLCSNVTAAQAASTQFLGATVTLGGKLTVNFYAQIANPTNARMNFNLDGGDDVHQTVFVTEAIKVSEGVYVFPCTVGTVQMTQTIKATLLDGSTTVVKTFSVRDYAATSLAQKDWINLSATDVVTATINYGAALQATYAEKFGAPTDPANSILPDDFKARVDAVTADDLNADRVVVTNGSTVSFYGYQMLLGSETTLSVYFAIPADAGVADLAKSVSDAGVAVSGCTYDLATISGQRMLRVNIPNIGASKLSTRFTVTVADAAIEVSPRSFMYSAIKAGSKDAAICKAMYLYSVESDAYVADLYGNGKDNTVTDIF